MTKLSAFSLLEVVLYVFVFGALSVALYNFGAVSLQSNARSQALAEVEMSGAEVMLKLVRLINEAPEAGGVNYPSIGASSTSLSLVSLTTSSNPVVIALENGQITLKQGASSSVPLTGNRVLASELNFVNLGVSSTNQVLSVEFKLAAGAGSELQDFKYSQVFNSSAQPLRR
jgi:hypothetical protein